MVDALPPGMVHLPRDRHGRPVPWFAAWINGEPDFRIVPPGKLERAHRLRLCWVCGGGIIRPAAFTIGPMCGVNRVSAEPPGHRACAVYSATHCPFLATPHMRRRPLAGTVKAAGVAIDRNPGVTLVWLSRAWSRYRVPAAPGVRPGWLWSIGEPVEALWFAHGRPATRAEVEHSLATGMPLLADAARAEGPDAMAELDAFRERLTPLLPAG